MTSFSLTQGLHRRLLSRPNSIATISDNKVFTFAEWGDRIAHLAGGIRSLGVSEGDRVAILSHNSNEYLESVLGILWAGAVLVPLNVRWSADELAFALADADVQHLIVDSSFSRTARELAARMVIKAIIVVNMVADEPGVLDYETLIQSSVAVEDTCRNGEDLAGLFYTGGTTGFPKGVMLSHRNLMASCLGGMVRGNFLTPNGRYLHAAPMFHLGDLSMFFDQVILGGSHVVVPGFSAESAVRSIITHDVTDIVLVPTMIRMLTEELERTGVRLPSLVNIVYGGSPVEESTLRRAFAVLPGVRFTGTYGLTEMAPLATMLNPEEHCIDGPLTGRLRSSGLMVAHVELKIVDESRKVVPVGTIGEISCRGPGVMQGYWKKPEETSRTLENGWLFTGDAGFIDSDGYLFVVDRLKDMIISGGENIYSAEVENAVASHRAVASCAVIAAPDERWGERVHAFVVKKTGAEVSVEELQAHIRERIAGYKVPRTFDFVKQLPLSAAGKVQKNILRGLLERT